MYQNLWYLAQTSSRGRFIAPNVYFGKEEKPTVNLSPYLKNLETKQNKSKSSCRKEIIKIRIIIGENANRKIQEHTAK